MSICIKLCVSETRRLFHEWLVLITPDAGEEGVALALSVTLDYEEATFGM